MPLHTVGQTVTHPLGKKIPGEFMMNWPSYGLLAMQM